LAAQRVAADAPAGLPSELACDDEARQRPRQWPARARSRARKRGPVDLRRAQKSRMQLSAPALAFARILELGVGVTVDRLPRKLVDVGEHGLREVALHRLVGAGRRGRAAHAAPGDPRPHTVRRLQRVEAAAGTVLAVAEPAVDLGGAAGLVADETAQSELRPGANTVAELAAQRARILGDLLLDRRDHFVRERGEDAPDCLGGMAIEPCICARRITLP